MRLPVLYEDPWLAVVAKPAGLMVHDSALAADETDFAADRLREQFGRPIHLVHRLDRAGHLVDVLPTNAAGAHEALDDLRIGDRQAGVDDQVVGGHGPIVCRSTACWRQGGVGRVAKPW